MSNGKEKEESKEEGDQEEGSEEEEESREEEEVSSDREDLLARRVGHPAGLLLSGTDAACFCLSALRARAIISANRNRARALTGR